MTSFQAGTATTPRTGNPRIRASDADRDLTAAQLREHFAAGRLSAAEGTDRIGQALVARTLGELDELMADLPGPGPGLAGSPGAVPAGPESVRSSAPWPSRIGVADGGAPRPLTRDAARSVVLVIGIILAAYAVTGLLTGIWWIPWALVVVPAAHVIRRLRAPELCAGRPGRGMALLDRDR
jgi:hypothetical protein